MQAWQLSCTAALAAALTLTACGTTAGHVTRPASPVAAQVAYDQQTLVMAMLAGLGNTVDPQGSQPGAAWCRDLAAGWHGLAWTFTVGVPPAPLPLQGTGATIYRACMTALAGQG